MMGGFILLFYPVLAPGVDMGGVGEPSVEAL